jgi:hypothetical protein
MEDYPLWVGLPYGDLELKYKKLLEPNTQCKSIDKVCYLGIEGASEQIQK